MKRNTETATAGQPSMSQNIFQWLQNIVLPFLKEQLLVLNPPKERDDTPKDIGEMGSDAEPKVDTMLAQKKKDLVEKLLSQGRIINPENQDKVVKIGSGVVLDAGGNKCTVFVVDCNFADTLQEYVDRKEVMFCSIASDLGKEILDKKVDEVFTVKAMKFTVKKILAPKSIETKIMSSFNIKIPAPAPTV